MNLPNPPAEYDRKDQAATRREIEKADTLAYHRNADVDLSQEQRVIFTDSVTSTRYRVTVTSAEVAVYDLDGVRYYPSSASVTFIQTGTGATARTVQAKLRDILDVLDFGADNTGSADATEEIQAALDEGYAQGKRVVGYGTFRTSAKITIKSDADFSQATFNVYSTPSIACEISTGNVANPTTPLVGVTVWAPGLTNMTKPATGWAAQGIGLRVVNAYSAQIFVGQVTGFTKGLLCTSYGTNGHVHNNYYLGWLENNEVNLDLNPGDGTSWVNQNQYYGGRCSHNSGEGTAVAGTRHIRFSKATEVVNGNAFFNTSIEGDVAQYHVEIGGAENLLIGARWEAATPKVLYTADNVNQGAFNFIERGYGADDIVFTYTGVTGYQNSAEGPSGSVSSVSLGHRIQNQSSSASPIFTFYEAGTLPETAAAGDWSAKIGAQKIEYKAKAETYARVQLNGANSRLYMGSGSAAATAYIGAIGSTKMGSFGAWFPGADNTYALGDSSLRWTNVYGTNLRPGAGTAIWTSGTGSPEGVVTAPVGSLFTRTDGGADTTLYRKESGTGNTGWAATETFVGLWIKSTTGLTALAGGAKAGATPLTGMFNQVATVATAADSVLLPAAVDGRDITVRNDGANACQVFAPTETINGVATATGVAQAAGTTVVYRGASSARYFT